MPPRANLTDDSRQAEGQTPARSALKSLPAVLILVVVTGLGLAADLLTKHYVFASLLSDPALETQVQRYAPHAEPEAILRDLQVARQVMPGVQFRLSTNPGVVFGLKPHQSPAIRQVIVAGATLVSILLVVGFFAASPARAVPTHIALGCILAGALGNLYDRLLGEVTLPGLPGRPIENQVRDFVDFSQMGYPWIFNIADVLLVAGVAILIVTWLLSGLKQRKESARTD